MIAGYNLIGEAVRLIMKTNKEMTEILTCMPVQEHDYTFISKAADLMNKQPVPTEDRFYWDPETDTVKPVGA